MRFALPISAVLSILSASQFDSATNRNLEVAVNHSLFVAFEFVVALNAVTSQRHKQWNVNRIAVVLGKFLANLNYVFGRIAREFIEKSAT